MPRAVAAQHRHTPHTPLPVSQHQHRGAYAAAAALPRRSIARCSAITRNAQILRPRRRSARRAGVVMRTHKMRPVAAANAFSESQKLQGTFVFCPCKRPYGRRRRHTCRMLVVAAAACAHRRQSDRESGAPLLFSTSLKWVVTMKRAAVGSAWPRRTRASCGVCVAARAGCTRRA